MRRNVAGQFVGAQMITAADGTAFTGSVTVYVTGNAGTQAVGSVGSGACTHEGNGFHSYAPAQAETNYTHVAFTFVGTGAIPATVQIYPTAYDANGRADLGAISGSAVSTSSAQLGVNVVNAAGTAWGSGAITAASIATDAITAAKIAADAIGASELAADAVTEIQSGLATAAALATVDGIVDDILVDTGTTIPATLAFLPTAVAGLMPTTRAVNTTTATINSQTNFTLTAAFSDEDDAYNGYICHITSFDDSEECWIPISDYVGSTRTVTLERAPQFTIFGSTLEEVEIFAVPVDMNVTGIEGGDPTDAINAAVVDALATDTYGEPTGVPGATVSLAEKIGRLYMALRNQVTVTATKKTYYDDGGSAEWEKDLSDDGTTYTESEGNAI